MQGRLGSREIVALCQRINRILHRAKVEKEKRAPTVASLLLALDQSDGVDLHDDGELSIREINARAKRVFGRSDESHLWEQVRIAAPRTGCAAYVRALDEVVRELRSAEVLAATRDIDILGAFFEGFLRHGNTAKDLGIVLTPRHICWLAAEILDIQASDVVYDPAAGTGGFLIAAHQRARPAAPQLYGCEVSGLVASLALVNMHFRAEARHNLRNESCFESAEATRRNITRVLMNPPFALQNEPESKFVLHALDRMRTGGLLFAVLPSSVMYSKRFGDFREQLLDQHSLLAVMLLPGDLFYPMVNVETLGVVVKAWRPHGAAGVLWARLADDGFIKLKKARVERRGADPSAALTRFIEVARAWCVGGRASAAEPGQWEFCPIRSTELLPQAHLGTAPLRRGAFRTEIGRCLRDYVAAQWTRGDGHDEKDR